MSLGVSAIICFLHACRHQNESKSRKYLAKVLWLLSYDDEKSSLMEALDKYAVGVPPLHWLPWIQQLLCSLVQYEGTAILNLLSQVGQFVWLLLFSFRGIILFHFHFLGWSHFPTSRLLSDPYIVFNIENRAT